MAKRGLPVVPTLRLLPFGVPADVTDIVTLDDRGVFLKLRTGARGSGAFAVRKTSEGLDARMFSGEVLQTQQQVQVALDALLERGDVLCQPLFETHNDLAAATPAKEAIAIRVVTRREGSGAGIVAAYMRIPTVLRHSQSGVSNRDIIDVFAGIDKNVGQNRRNENSRLALHPMTAQIEDGVFANLDEAAIVPFWPEICQSSLIAQTHFNRFWALAWDWVVTDAGPILLEGNINWGLTRPQEVEGGLLWLVRDGEPNA